MLETQKQTLESVRQLCQQLLEAGYTSTEFMRTLLPHLIERAQLQAAAVWMNDDHSRLRLITEYQLADLSTSGQFYVDQAHQEAVGDVIEQMTVRVLLNRKDDVENVLPHSLAIGPLILGDRAIGAIEVFGDAQQTDDTYLHDLIERVAAYSSKALSQAAPPQVRREPVVEQATHPTPAASPVPAPTATPQPAAPAADRRGESTAFWEQFDRFLHGLRRLDVKDVAANAANDGRILLGCDRVSIIVREGKRTRVRAVSGQEDVHQRANLIRTLTDLARRVMKTGERLVYTGSADNLPPPLEQPLATYLGESRMRMVAMIPLRDPRRAPTTDHEGQRVHQTDKRDVIGCLVVEQANESEPRVGMLSRVDLVAPHIAEAIADAEQHESIFLLPLWRVMGRTLRWFRGRRLTAALAILAGLGLLGLAMAYVPWTYRVTAEGKLMPVTQHEIFAPENGDIREVLVRGGDLVKTGDPLIRLKNPELQAEIVSTRSAALEKEKQAVSLGHQSAEAAASGKTDESIRYRGEQVRSSTEAEGLKEKLRVLEERAERLVVRSPANGTVATFQVEQVLKDRPVQRGERLLEVMDETGPWRLELEIPEHRMGHLLRAMQTTSTQSLPLQYVPATAVETTLTGTLKASHIATRSNQSQEDGAIVEVRADISDEAVPNRRIGAEVTARIDCGQRSLFYVLFGDVVEFIQRHVWW